MRTFRYDAVRGVAIAVLFALALIPAVALWRQHAQAHSAQDFTLVDHFGRPFHFAAERGRPVVLFFGYTHCPDICPTTLADIAHARAALGAAGRGIAVLFVTVDPHRDTPAAMRRYLALFDPSFLGLTGTAEQLAPVYEAYHVYHRVEPATDTASGYLVTHSATVYFIARDGRVQIYGDWTDSRATLTKDLMEILS
jgi:protein SCO1/2